MTKKEKNLCKWKKSEIDEEFERLCGIIGSADYVCRKCGRAASKKKWLCKPGAAEK